MLLVLANISMSGEMWFLNTLKILQNVSLSKVLSPDSHASLLSPSANMSSDFTKFTRNLTLCWLHHIKNGVVTWFRLATLPPPFSGRNKLPHCLLTNEFVLLAWLSFWLCLWQLGVLLCLYAAHFCLSKNLVPLFPPVRSIPPQPRVEESECSCLIFALCWNFLPCHSDIKCLSCLTSSWSGGCIGCDLSHPPPWAFWTKALSWSLKALKMAVQLDNFSLSLGCLPSFCKTHVSFSPFCPVLFSLFWLFLKELGCTFLWNWWWTPSVPPPALVKALTFFTYQNAT